jgi:uncharacterized membrane protein
MSVLLYVAIVIGAILSYPGAREIMIKQDVWIETIISPITVNVVLFLFMWGVVADKRTKGMSRKKGWLIWGLGFVAIIIVFRFIGGMPTIFG